jgi:two-component system response regulator DesR
MEGGAKASWSRTRPGGGAGRRDPAGARREIVIDPALAAAALTAGPNPLTDRERDVLTAAADGATIADVAAALHLSESTVRNYLSAAIGKTGTRNRIEAVRAARAAGWL